MTEDDKALVGRLREADDWYFDEPWERVTLVSDAPYKAADRIEQLTAEVERLREALGVAKDALHHRGGPLCSARYYEDEGCTCGVADAQETIRAALEGKQ